MFPTKDRAKNGASKRGAFFGSRFISRAAKTENLVPRSFFARKQHGNACYAGYVSPCETSLSGDEGGETSAVRRLKIFLRF